VIRMHELKVDLAATTRFALSVAAGQVSLLQASPGGRDPIIPGQRILYKQSFYVITTVN
jgi:hypothetical protein